MAWQVAAGHDNEAGLTDMAQQPAAPDGIVYPVLRFAADGSAYRDGQAYCDLRWNVLGRLIVGETPSMRDTLLTQFGLSDSTSSALVTVQIRDNTNAFANYNATAILLDTGQRATGRWENLTIRLTHLELLPEA